MTDYADLVLVFSTIGLGTTAFFLLHWYNSLKRLSVKAVLQDTKLAVYYIQHLFKRK